jgi:hypothetical protein
VRIHPCGICFSIQGAGKLVVDKWNAKGGAMTQLLEEAIAKVRELSPEDQDLIATLILEEIEDEKRWDETFGNSPDQLAKMATKVRDDIKAGRFYEGGFGEW